MDILETLSDGWESIKESFASIPEFFTNIPNAFSEMNTTSLVLGIIFWLFFAFMIDFVPEMLGLKGNSLSTKIIATCALLPISYLIVDYMAHKS